MGKVFKTIAIFLAILIFGTSCVSVATCFSPVFREKVENFLKIEDENSIKTLKTKIETLEKERDELQEEVDGYNARVESLRSQIRELEARIEELQAQDRDLNSQIANLQAQVRSLESQVTTLENTIDGLNAQVEALDKEVDNVWDLFETYEVYVQTKETGEYTPEIVVSEEANQALTKKINELENKIETLTETVEELTEQIEELTEEIENLEEEKQEAVEAKEETTIIIEEKTVEVNDARTQIQNLNTTVNNITNNITINVTKIEELEEKKESGTITETETQQLADLKQTNANLETQKVNINQELSILQTKVDRIESEIAVLEINNQNYERQIQQLDTRIETLQVRVDDLSEETTETQANITSLQAKVDKLQGFDTVIIVEVEGHTHTKGEPVRENEVEATCLTDGSYELNTYCIDDDTLMKKEIVKVPALGHIENEPVIENKITKEDGTVEYDEVIYCGRCGEEISREHKVIAPEHEHSPSEESVMENYVEAEDGSISYDLVVYCTTCEEELSREHIVINSNVSSEEELILAIENCKNVTLQADIDLKNQLNVTKNVVLDLNGHSLFNTNDIWSDESWSLISVQGGTLTINGNGSLIAKENDCYAVDIRDNGNLIINGGTYAGNITAVYIYNGNLVVNDGYFYVQQSNFNAVVGQERFVLNCFDTSYKNGSATVTILGGTFEKFNPADCVAEGEHTNFVPDGNIIEINETTYKVVSKENHEHKPGEIIIENEITNEDGSVEYDKVTYCSDCKEEISREHIVEEKTDIIEFGESVFNIPITEIQNLESITNYFEISEEFGVEFIPDEMLQDDSYKQTFPGIVTMLQGMSNDENLKNYYFCVILYDTEENAQFFIDNKETYSQMFGESFSLKYLAKYGKVIVFEMFYDYVTPTYRNTFNVNDEYELVSYNDKAGLYVKYNNSDEETMIYENGMNYYFSEIRNKDYEIGKDTLKYVVILSHQTDGALLYNVETKSLTQIIETGTWSFRSEKFSYNEELGKDELVGFEMINNDRDKKLTYTFETETYVIEDYEDINSIVDFENNSLISFVKRPGIYLRNTKTNETTCIYENGNYWNFNYFWLKEKMLVVCKSYEVEKQLMFDFDTQTFEELEVDSSWQYDHFELSFDDETGTETLNKLYFMKNNQRLTYNYTTKESVIEDMVFYIKINDEIRTYSYGQYMNFESFIRSEYNTDNWVIYDEHTLYSDSLGAYLQVENLWNSIQFNMTYEATTEYVEYKERIKMLWLNTNYMEMQVNGSSNLIARYEPAYLEEKLVWTSSDTSIATVDENGIITALALGKVNITVSTEDGKFSSSCEVTVLEKIIEAQTFRIYVKSTDKEYENIYEFETGMTLQDWINSDYNTGNWHIEVAETGEIFLIGDGVAGQIDTTELTSETTFYVYSY